MLDNEPVEKLHEIIFMLFSGVSLPLPVTRSSIVGHSTWSFFHASPTKCCSSTYPTGSTKKSAGGGRNLPIRCIAFVSCYFSYYH
jgi:hypothetical protein